MHYFFAIIIAISTFHIVTSACPTNCKAGQTCDAADSGCTECEREYFGRQCQHGLECRFSNRGAEYRGKRNTSVSGITCQRWDTNFPHAHNMNLPKLWENYCRNPNDMLGPWCYTTDPNLRWEYCITHFCIDQCTSPSLKRAFVDVTNPPPLGFTVGFNAIIECMKGYEASVQPTVATITCQNDKTWTDSILPTCNKVQCPSPELANGRITNPKLKYEYQDRVIIECDRGYTLQGQSTLTCQADKSWGPLPSTCNINECPEPATVPNSVMLDTKDKYVYLDSLTIKCNIGYTLQGQKKIQCQADETWTALPTCEINKCNKPMISNGSISPSPSKPIYQYNDKIVIGCDVGYTLQGQAELTCQANKTWGAIPPCIINKCPSIKYIPNSNIGNSSVLYKYNDVMSIICDTGFAVKGSSKLTCQANKTWDMDPPTCERVKCPQPSMNENSKIRDPKPEYEYQDIVTIVCDTGYVLQGHNNFTCQADAFWNPSIPICSKVKCAQPSVKANSKIRDLKPEYEYQDSVIIVCDTGYVLQGHNNLTCQADASWDSSVPVCSSNDCDPPKLNNNSKMTVTKTTFHRGDIVEFLCETGFILHGPTQLTCLGNWTWHMEPPICKIVECSLPSLPGTITLLNPKHNYFYGDYITFICTEGHEFHGGNTSVCKDTAQWSEPFPLCKKINCTGLKFSSNILISSPKKYTYSYNDKVSFHCDEGFKLSHDNDLVCQANKLWDKEEPFCIEICNGLSTSMWVGITVGLNLANTLLTILIMCRCRLRDKTNNTPPVSAINTKNAAFDDYDSIDVNEKDEQNIYNVPE